MTDPALRDVRMEAYVAHVLALLVTFGFYGLAGMVLLGFVDIKDPTTAGLVGTVLGAASVKVQAVFARYFKVAFAGPEPGPKKEDQRG